MQQESERDERIERRQDRRRAQHFDQAKQADGDEPGEHDRAEETTDRARAETLGKEQRQQNHHRQRHHDRGERGGGHFQPLDGAEHGNGRRDGAVAIKQRGTDQADDQQDHLLAAAPAGAALKDGEQRYDAAFALVVGAQDQHRVFQRNDQDQRPEDQRHDAGYDPGLAGTARTAGIDGL